MMKNRTILGIFCIVAAFLVFFLVMPGLKSPSRDTAEILVARTKIPRGTLLEESMFSRKTVSREGLTGEELTEWTEAQGKYALCDIFSGDGLIPEKLGGSVGSPAEVLYRLKDGEVAVTVSVSTFAGGFSGQLENGDIVKLYVPADGIFFSPPELAYVRVVTTLTSAGEDRETARNAPSRTGSDLPSSIMFAVNERQAGLLFHYAREGNLSCAFVCHQQDPRAADYLRSQERYFAAPAQEASSSAAAAGEAGPAAPEAEPWQ